jgi:glycerol uptake facilitator protein
MLTPMSPLMGEVIGTAAMVMLGTAAICRLRSASPERASPSAALALASAAAAFVGLLVAASLGAGHLNPALTLGLYMAGHFPGDRVQPFMLAQGLGAFLGAVLMWLTCLPQWGQARDGRTLECFCPEPPVRAPLGLLVCEMVGTVILVAGFLALRRACNADAMTSLVEGRGILLWAVGGGGITLGVALAVGAGSGLALNPARDLGPRLAHALLPMPGKGPHVWKDAWTALIGPLLGAWLAGALARIVA